MSPLFAYLLGLLMAGLLDLVAVALVLSHPRLLEAVIAYLEKRYAVLWESAGERARRRVRLEAGRVSDTRRN